MNASTSSFPSLEAERLEGARSMLLLKEDLQVQEPSGKEESKRWQAGSQRHYFPPQTNCSRLSQDTVQIPSGPCYLPFQPQTQHTAGSTHAVHYTWEGSCVLPAISWLSWPTQRLAKLLQAARQPEVRSPSSSAQSQHSSAGNTFHCLAIRGSMKDWRSCSIFCFLSSGHPPTSFAGISHYAHCRSTVKSNRSSYKPTSAGFSISLAHCNLSYCQRRSRQDFISVLQRLS